MTVESDLKKLRDEFEEHKTKADSNWSGCFIYIIWCMVLALYFDHPKVRELLLGISLWAGELFKR